MAPDVSSRGAGWQGGWEARLELVALRDEVFGRDSVNDQPTHGRGRCIHPVLRQTSHMLY